MLFCLGDFTHDEFSMAHQGYKLLGYWVTAGLDLGDDGETGIELVRFEMRKE